MVYPGSRPKCKEDVARLWDWFNGELKDSKIKVVLNTDVTPDMVKKINPDALVIATGTEQILPDIPGN